MAETVYTLELQMWSEESIAVFVTPRGEGRSVPHFLTLPSAFLISEHPPCSRARFEAQPVAISIFGHIRPAEHVPQKRSRCLRVVGVNQGVNRGDHKVAVRSIPAVALVFAFVTSKILYCKKKAQRSALRA